MKIAFTIHNDRISPVFGTTETILVIEVSNNRVKKRAHINVGDMNVFERTAELASRQVDKLICGAISGCHERVVIASGIDVLSFRCGNIDMVISAFLKHQLSEDGFNMPGCCNRQRRHGRRRCQ